MWPFQVALGLYWLKIAGYFALLQREPAGAAIGDRSAGEAMPPSVDIILPMYNEAKVVAETIGNLLQIAYERLSIIVVDDGSTDGSYDVVKTHFGEHPRVRLMRQPNSGKSAALNYAMQVSTSEIVVSIDADTWVRPDAIANIVPYFQDSAVAAVAGHIKVGNRVNVLTDMQYFEYIALWDNDRAVSEGVNGILIVPGALGAFRRSAVDAVGGFRSAVIAEDTELTLRLIYHSYRIRNAVDAVAYTEAPDNLRMFFRQRIRWTTGLTQGLMKHARRLFAHSRELAFIILPYTWLFRIILPLFLPLLDYYLVCLCVTGHFQAIVWWLAVVLTEAAANLFILAKFKERISPFKLVLLQRLYRHLLFCSYWLILAKGINGTLFRWRKIVRKGNIQLEEPKIRN